MAVRNVLKKTIKEDGVILYRQFKKAMESFTGSDGRRVDALPDRWVVGVICGTLHPTEGFAEARVLEEFKVEQKDFAKMTYGKEVVATCEMVGDRIKPISVELKQK
jgi:hypothetical protein